MKRVDVLVVGAGIVGAGTARLAARAGLSVALVDRGDIACGTSSRSSHMVHGGLRYLEHGHFGLVREALRERAALVRMAPHLVSPARFLVPFYRGDRRPGWVVGAGLALYDALAGTANLEPHRALSARSALNLAPALEPRGLLGGALYSDAVMDDARLALAVALDAAEHGAEIATYTEVTGIRAAGDAGLEVDARDLLDGSARGWHARAVVNAAGPWADEVRSRVSGPASPRGAGRAAPGAGAPMLRPSRGSHVAFPAFGMPCGMLFFSRADGRVLFLVPRLDHVLLGTTEVEGAGDPGADLPAADEVRYLLRETRRLLPQAGLEPARALGLMTGVRPLARKPGRSLGAVPREHRVTVEGRVVHVVGGKYTTFQPMCAAAMRAAARVLGARLPPPADDALPGGALPGPADRAPDFAAFARDEAVRLGALFPEAAAELPRLLRAHGSRTRHVLERAPGEARPLEPGLPVLEGEVRYAVEVERARRLADVMRRRTSLWLAPDFGRRAAPAVARRMAELQGWDAARAGEELAAWQRFADAQEHLLRALGDAA
jgi:glycerol-3-phosphate dehydrogenase